MTDAYLYHLAQDLKAVFEDALKTERAAERKAAAMRGASGG